MNHKSKTTGFSFHLSRSRMSRYLHDQLSEKEIKEVEQHLGHCEQCSEGITAYIQNEEPQHSKAFQKRLKGKLRSKKSGRKVTISSTQKKIARAAAALLLLFIFSFFGINTVMNKHMAGKEEVKTEIRVKKKQQIKKQNTTPRKEQKTDNTPVEELSSVW